MWCWLKACASVWSRYSHKSATASALEVWVCPLSPPVNSNKPHTYPPPTQNSKHTTLSILTYTKHNNQTKHTLQFPDLIGRSFSVPSSAADKARTAQNRTPQHTHMRAVSASASRRGRCAVGFDTLSYHTKNARTRNTPQRKQPRMHEAQLQECQHA